MGLGDIWTESAFHFTADEKLQAQVYKGPMQELQTQRLNETLAIFASPPTSGIE